MDIFFEALNYEKIEQKKAYELAGLLGEINHLSTEELLLGQPVQIWMERCVPLEMLIRVEHQE